MNDDLANLGELAADGYGIAVFSPAAFNSFLEERKCRARKYITYFDKNKQLFFDLIKAGILLPFYQIPSFQYSLFTSVDKETVSIPEGYKVIYHYKDFFITIGTDQKICFASFNFLEHYKDKIDAGETDFGKEIPSGSPSKPEWYNAALSTPIESGEYQFDLYGLTRVNALDRESKNFAFLFAFRKSLNPIKDNFQKCDNDLHQFNIVQAYRNN
ncbi:MAG: hypothetical protein ACRYFX_23465 [Janthinobacterium lividum]